MNFNNGSNSIASNNNNYRYNKQDEPLDNPRPHTTNLLAGQPSNKAILSSKSHRIEDLELFKSESNFIHPVDTYIMPQTQNLENTTQIDEVKKNMNYYSSVNKSEMVDTSLNDVSVGDGMTNNDGIMNSALGNDNTPKLQNIVSTVNLKCKLDLRDIALKTRNAEYNPKRFAAVIMRIREPKTTALIFASGKMVCTGARSEEDSKKAARRYAKIIANLGNDVRFTEFTIQNIVGSCDVKFPIRLEGLAASDNSKFCSYEPEMFPGLIYRMHSPKIVLLIFVSGKIVLTGAKNREDIYKAYKTILPILKHYKKKEIISSVV